MASEPSLEGMFQEWNDLNKKAQESLGQFDFSKIKEIRKKQEKLEDSIFNILKDNAPDNIKKILPEVGEMEVGFESEGNIFYFVMYDPEDEDDENPKLIAITLDANKKVDMIKDFEIE